MSLCVGERLGPYEILAAIGAGGMGEVYRAHDTKLKRDVALKVLPDAFAHDPERMARFQREAEVLASLNHPNIAAIYGVEDRALVMELVEGDSPKGPLSFDGTWHIASQIAAALEYAHDKGIVHRDLKPANIKITPEGVVKLLDFGLAKAFTNQREAPASAGVNSPTLTIAATEVGMILGTAAYMSPEQAKGKSVDKRADIWAFGVVLYELLTGDRLFSGEDVAETLAAVIHKQPDLTKTPREARRLLEECLQKDPKQRLRDIGDAKRLLGENAAAVAAASVSRLGRLPWIAAGMLAIAFMLALAGWYRATRPVEKPLMRMSVDLGPNAVAGVAVTTAISPDGTRIVFPMRSPDGKQQLGMRLLEQTQATLLPGSAGASDPFFSPDGQWIGFFADSKMKKISVLGGAPLTLCDAPLMRGASWGEDGNIIVALNGGGLSRVPAAGGTPQPLTQLERGELTHRWPQVLPGGTAVLFTSSHGNVTYFDATVEALSRKTGVRKTVVTSAYFGRYLPTNGSTGHLIYVHDGTLFAVPFDPDRLELRGTPAPILEDLAAVITLGAAQFDFSQTGTFVYRSGTVADQSWPVVWLDSSGKTQPLVTKPNGYTTPRFSPDGRLLALALGAGGAREFQIYDWQRGTMSRLVLTTEANFYPTWSPDGKYLAFRSATPTGSKIQWTRVDGSSEPVPLLETKGIALPYSFSPEGRLAYRDGGPETGLDLWTLPLDLRDPDHPKPGKPEPFLRTRFNETFAMFSPNGHWIAYQSDESGRNEVYVRPFPGPGEKWQVSTGGGTLPLWSRDGRELFFENPDNRIMVADCMVKASTFASGKPRLWSETPIRDIGGISNYGLAPDGKRFAVFPVPEPAAEEKGSLHVTFLLNFFDELRRKVPAGK